MNTQMRAKAHGITHSILQNVSSICLDVHTSLPCLEPIDIQVFVLKSLVWIY